LFATNNATRLRSEFVARLAEVGVPATVDELATSASATAVYLRRLETAPETALVIGADALAIELAGAGIATWDEPNGRPDCVVASLDRQFTYDKLARAQQAVLQGALLVATNRDPQFPGAHGRLWPGAGSVVAAVETACRRTAISIGKPGPLLYRTLLESAGADVRRTIVVGDNLETDIAAAVAMNLPSVLVLTGISQRDDIPVAPAKPTIVIDRLTELLGYDLEKLVASAVSRG
jgi:4-nitrophenyl phosphatase